MPRDMFLGRQISSMVETCFLLKRTSHPNPKQCQNSRAKGGRQSVPRAECALADFKAAFLCRMRRFEQNTRSLVYAGENLELPACSKTPIMMFQSGTKNQLLQQYLLKRGIWRPILLPTSWASLKVILSLAGDIRARC